MTARVSGGSDVLMSALAQFRAIRIGHRLTKEPTRFGRIGSRITADRERTVNQ